MPSIFHTRLIDWIHFKYSLIYLYIQVLLSVYSDNSGNRLQIVNFPSKCGILMWQLFTICDLTTFLGFHVGIADSTPSTRYRELCTTHVMMYCYDVILKFQKCMKQLPFKDLVCLSYSRRIHEGARHVLYNLFKLICIWIIFSKIPMSLDKLKDILCYIKYWIYGWAIKYFFMYWCIKFFLIYVAQLKIN